GGDPVGAPLDVTGRRPPPPAPVIGRGDARSDYAYAKSLIDRGDYELAEGAFRDFLRAHPKDRRAAEAHFFLGESYLRRTRYREAAEQFLTVTSQYASAPRAPEAMLKLGIALRGLGANQEACGTFAQVGRKYPNAPAEIKQAVERERARAQC
ncbi:MAG: tol-pal system protein YbgF, partial [Hyphomicrobiales bacterium]|nr:tol-pal system protein YbgF [Hyphomicrobiales bacterium]